MRIRRSPPALPSRAFLSIAPCSPRSSRRSAAFPIAEYGTPSTPELPAAVRKYIKAHDGLLLANHGALTIGPDVYAAYYKMETIEHFAKISLVTRQLGRENLLSREEVHRLQELRGNYGIKSPAPICADGSEPANDDPASCQIVEAPSSRGARLDSDRSGGFGRGNSAIIPRAYGPH